MLKKYCKNNIGIKSDTLSSCTYISKKWMFLKLNLIKFSVMLLCMKNHTYLCVFMYILYDFSYVTKINFPFHKTIDSVLVNDYNKELYRSYC